jgi:hypothetical protein
VTLNPLGTSATNWPIVPAPDDRWWIWSSRWNENWQGKQKYSEKTCPTATLPTTEPTWPDLDSYPGPPQWEAGDKPPELGGRTTYRTLSPKSTPFQIGIDWWSHLRKVPRRRWISHTHSMRLWGCSPCKISSPGPVFHGTKWLLWRPQTQSHTFHSRCRINKGLIKRGSTIEHWRSRCKGWILWLIPYTYIYTYIHTYNRLSYGTPY